MRRKGQFTSEQIRKRNLENNPMKKLETRKKVSKTRKRLFKEGKIKNWTDGLTKETDIRLKDIGKKISKTFKEKFKNGFKGGFQKGNKYWDNPKVIKSRFQKGRISSNKGRIFSEDEKKIISRTTKEAMKRPEVKRKHLEAMRNPERRKKQSERMMGNLNPTKRIDIRKKLSKAKLGNKYNLGNKHTEESIKKIKEARAKQILQIKETSIEIKIKDFLKQLGIDFFTHQYMKEIEHSYQCDILIPSMNLVIECDGDYWHKYPIGLEKDHIRTKELIEKGFKVLRLWEYEIRVMKIEEFKGRII